MTPDDVDPAKRRYAVIGTGAIGGYYGARLAAAGHEVHVVARSDLEVVAREGLSVESPLGDLLVRPVSVVATTEEVPPVDLVLLAVKTTSTVPAADLVGPATVRGAAAVLMQNGLGVEDALAAALPDATILGAMCFMCSNKVGPGCIRHLDYGAVTVGAHARDPRAPAGITPVVTAFVDDLVGAGVPAHGITDLRLGRWKKLVWNIAYNGLSVVLDASTDELMADPSTRALAISLMHEVAAGAAACGHLIPDSFIDDMVRTTDAMTPYKTSMKLDAEAGRPLEIAAIYRAPVEAARAAGTSMDRTEAICAQLEFIDARHLAHR